ncbi:MAG: hypothetical protein K5885_08550 [Bacteroidales bacterium]|nr:hypothetical protein [Bacteroidales bacterium]
MNTNDIDIFNHSAGGNEDKTPLPQVESLRPLVRSALMKDELSELDAGILIRKAVAVGFDAEEFGLLLDAMVAAKKRGAKKSLFRKPNYDDYFEFEFDDDFDKTFLTEEERKRKDLAELDDAMKMMDDVSDFAKKISNITKLFE